MADSYVHQDWKTIVLRQGGATTKPPRSSGPPPQAATVASTTGTPAWKVEQRADAETGKPISYVTKTDACSIVKRRVAMKLSQRDLAMRINVDVKEIQAIEACRAVENRGLLAKIRRAMET
jgi:ribosome-binding protein aMBF1 (putative translation factor)